MEVVEFFALFPHWFKEGRGEKILDLFTDLEVKMVGLEMHRQWKETQTVDFPSVLDKIESFDLKARLRKGLLGKESQDLNEAAWKVVFTDCLKRIQRNDLERIEKRLLNDIKSCEGDGAKEDQKVRLLNEYQNIVRQKSQL